MDRRGFVRGLIAAPMVFGLGKLGVGSELGGQDAEGLVKIGLKRMKELGLPGLVIVPPKDENRRMELGRGLFRLVKGISSPEADDFVGPKFQAVARRGKAVTWTCVIICLEEEEAWKEFGETSPRMVIDERGKVLRRMDDPPESVEQNLAKRLIDLVHGAKIEHLEERVARLKKTLPKELAGSYEAFLRDMAEREAPLFSVPRTAEYKKLVERAKAYLEREPRLSGWFGLALLRITSRKNTYLDALFDSLRKDRLPLGTSMPRFVPMGCLSYTEVKPGMAKPKGEVIACGMPSLSSTGGRFLRFVAKVK